MASDDAPGVAPPLLKGLGSCSSEHSTFQESIMTTKDKATPGGS